MVLLLILVLAEDCLIKRKLYIMSAPPCQMILTSNKSYTEWGELLADHVLAAAHHDLVHLALPSCGRIRRDGFARTSVRRRSARRDHPGALTQVSVGCDVDQADIPAAVRDPIRLPGIEFDCDGATCGEHPLGRLLRPDPGPAVEDGPGCGGCRASRIEL